MARDLIAYLCVHDVKSNPYCFRADETCKCGSGDNFTEFTDDNKLWCCKTTNDNCAILGGNYANCTGMALSLSKECHSQTCNYYPWHKYRNGYSEIRLPRSHLNICGDGRYTANISRVELMHRL